MDSRLTCREYSQKFVVTIPTKMWRYRGAILYDRGCTYIFRYLNPIPTRGALQRLHQKFPRGYIPEIDSADRGVVSIPFSPYSDRKENPMKLSCPSVKYFLSKELSILCNSFTYPTSFICEVDLRLSMLNILQETILVFIFLWLRFYIHAIVLFMFSNNLEYFRSAIKLQSADL